MKIKHELYVLCCGSRSSGQWYYVSQLKCLDFFLIVVYDLNQWLDLRCYGCIMFWILVS